MFQSSYAVVIRVVSSSPSGTCHYGKSQLYVKANPARSSHSLWEGFQANSPVAGWLLSCVVMVVYARLGLLVGQPGINRPEQSDHGRAKPNACQHACQSTQNVLNTPFKVILTSAPRCARLSSLATGNTRQPIFQHPELVPEQAATSPGSRICNDFKWHAKLISGFAAGMLTRIRLHTTVLVSPLEAFFLVGLTTVKHIKNKIDIF
eukprot:6213535-Pleurochrysis_carterae.AAC.2